MLHKIISRIPPQFQPLIPLVVVGVPVSLVLAFLDHTFGIVTNTFMIIQWIFVNLFLLLQFLVINLVTMLLHVVSQVAFCLFVFLLVLIPVLVITAIYLGVCAFKTKPTEESFKDYLNNFAKIAEVESKCIDLKEKEKEKEKSDDKQGYVSSGINYVWSGCRNYVQGKAINLLVKQKLLVSDSYTYNCIVCRMGVAPIDGKKHVFIGVYDSWQPWS